jgi:hypothetical protein
VDGGAADTELLEQAAPIVRAILARKSGTSLKESDGRSANLEAIELFHDVLARLWERLRSPGSQRPDIRDFKDYAASVAYNAWADHLRDKYPLRTSLKNRLRYFLGHQKRFAIWENAEGELHCGFATWQLAGRYAAPGRLGQLLGSSGRPRGLTVSGKFFDRWDASDWDRLLAGLFEQLGGATALDELVSALVPMLGIQESRLESIDVGDEEGDGGREVAAPESERVDQRAEQLSLLKRLWSSIRALQPDYRRAYLLNIPGPGKSRGDIEVFVLSGIASIAEIGETVDLTAEQLRAVIDMQELTAADRAEAASLNTPRLLFALLWKYLPIADTAIAAVLGMEPQQVINRRRLAMRELAKNL